MILNVSIRGRIKLLAAPVHAEQNSYAESSGTRDKCSLVFKQLSKIDIPLFLTVFILDIIYNYRYIFKASSAVTKQKKMSEHSLFVFFYTKDMQILSLFAKIIKRNKKWCNYDRQSELT